MEKPASDNLLMNVYSGGNGSRIGLGMPTGKGMGLFLLKTECKWDAIGTCRHLAIHSFASPIGGIHSSSGILRRSFVHYSHLRTAADGEETPRSVCQMKAFPDCLKFEMNAMKENSRNAEMSGTTGDLAVNGTSINYSLGIEFKMRFNRTERHRFAPSKVKNLI